MLHQVKSRGLCWWCGALSNSREHKVKRTDVNRIYGKGPYKLEKLGIYNIGLNSDNPPKPIQSSDSDYLKFEKCICQKYNNERSVPFGRAYDTFMDYVDKNLDNLKEESYIDVEKIYGRDYVEQKMNLFRYYSKHICCRLAINGYNIPLNIIQFLNRETSLKDINFQFQIKQYKIVFDKDSDESLQQLYIGEIKFHEHLIDKKIIAATGWYTYKQFSMNYVVSKNIIPRHYVLSKLFFYKRKIKLEKINYSRFIELDGISDERPISILVKLEEFPYIDDFTGELRLKALLNYRM